MEVAIIGFGVEGRAVAEYLLRHDSAAKITICDQRKIGSEELGALAPKVRLQCGKEYLKDLPRFDSIYRSPGVLLSTPELVRVREKVTSLTKLFFEKCPCPIVGVTGTKGKGTTTTLLAQMLREAKGKVYVGGNIGVSPTDFLDKLTPQDTVVLELSSFQLEDMDCSPHVAVVLGITPDHQDHHVSFEEYVAAKKNIVAHQQKGDVAILDGDDATSTSFAKIATGARGTHARMRLFSTKKEVADGGFIKVGSLILKDGSTGTIVGDANERGLIGPHNLKNILAAACAAQTLGVPVEVIEHVIRTCKGLPHRLEFVGTLNSARFYNDSASTNPETTIAAIRSFDAPTILIAGGSEKNLDCTNLGQAIATHLNVKTVVLMGQTAARIEKSIEEAVVAEDARIVAAIRKTGRDVPHRAQKLEIIMAEGYEEAFMVAKVLAQPGDIVLLSPGCASFDMFKNYAQRGDIFRDFVKSMA